MKRYIAAALWLVSLLFAVEGYGLELHTDAFNNGAEIPDKHTGIGGDVSPRFTWSGVPAGTKELALVVDDPDAPGPEPWVHWLLYKIPVTRNEIPEQIPPAPLAGKLDGALQGTNSWDDLGYRGPMPPPGRGPHRYRFKLYALDSRLPLKSGLNKRDLMDQMQGHVIAQADLVGVYER